MNGAGAPARLRHHARKRWVTAVAVALCLAGALAYLVPQARSFAAQKPRLEPGWFALASLAYAGFLGASSQQMRAALRALGADTRWPFAVFTLATLGKYLPTKAMVPVLRAQLVAPEGATMTVVIAALALEFTVGALVGTWFGFVLCATKLLHLPPALVVLAGFAGPALLAFAQRPAVANAVRRVVAVVLRRLPNAPLSLETLEPGLVVHASAWAMVSWIAGGASLAFTFQALGAGHELTLEIAGAFALASMAGYLAFVVPAGLGVREAGLLVLLGASLGAPVVAAAALAHRLVSTLTEIGLGSAAALWFARRRRAAER